MRYIENNLIYKCQLTDSSAPKKEVVKEKWVKTKKKLEVKLEIDEKLNIKKFEENENKL